ncbi:MAG: hypothetical protein LIO68_04300 [Rikenellaceae bacterium]|nr:hypothetical protein [Rikenellaceae bacterium]
MKQISNNELYALSGILSGMTVCGPGIPAEVSAKLIEAVCQVQEEAQKLRVKVDTIRDKTRPMGIEQSDQMTDEQQREWEKAIAGQLEILGSKPAAVKLAPLTPEEFRQAVAASPLTGQAAVLLRRALVDKEGGGNE